MTGHLWVDMCFVRRATSGQIRIYILVPRHNHNQSSGAKNQQTQPFTNCKSRPSETVDSGFQSESLYKY